jgi:general secretion pathway protein M
MKEQLRVWWEARDARERMLAGGGGAVALLLILYLAIWDPIVSSAKSLSTELPALRTAAAKFNQDATEAERLRATARNRGPAPSLTTAIDESAQRTNVKPAIKQVQSLGPDRAQVTLGPVAFDQLVRWLADMGQQGGVAVDSLQLAAAGPGRVTVDGLVLRSTRGGQ